MGRGSLLACALLLCQGAFGSEERGAEVLVERYNIEHQLSKKTIDQNRGHLYLYSRERLERMGARTLKDVLKTLPVIYYQENRYGLPDPLSGRFAEPYRSNFVRIYIDGVEVTQGWSGSGLLMYGDMDLGFVDHIECYFAPTSFDVSVEPAYLTVFVYSKEPERESNALALAYGSRGYNVKRLQVAREGMRGSLLANFSHTDAKRPKTPNGTDTPLSRDTKRTQFFVRYKDKEERFFTHLQWLRTEGDAYAGLSFDATPLLSKLFSDNVHFDIGYRFNPYWSAQINFEHFKSRYIFRDDTPIIPILPRFIGINAIDWRLANTTVTAELDFKRKFGKHIVTAGLKGRRKRLDKFSTAFTGAIPLSFDRESVESLYLQDQYLFAEGKMLNLGAEYIKIARNGGVQDDDLFQFRLGYVVSGETWGYKAYLYQAMYALDPVTRFMASAPAFRNLPAQKSRAFSAEVTHKSQRWGASRLSALWMKDTFGINNTYSPGEGNTLYRYAIFDHAKRFGTDAELTLMLYYARYDNIFDLPYLEDTSGALSWWQRFGRVDWYSDLVWRRNTVDRKHYFDLGMRLSWEARPNVTFTLKGENLLNKAKKTQFHRVDPMTLRPIAPFESSHIDRRVTIEWEYLF